MGGGAGAVGGVVGMNVSIIGGSLTSRALALLRNDDGDTSTTGNNSTNGAAAKDFLYGDVNDGIASLALTGSNIGNHSGRDG